jgi:NADH:ubiquinone oxidoreductase subunit K
MDELDILKKDWKKQESSFQQIGEKEIYGMLHKRSSSIVKWIVVISILELILWSSISLFTADEDYFKLLKIYHLDTAMPVIAVINYGVILYFIYLFYKNYKAINATDTIKQLMKSILKTRKTVKHYVWYNLGMTALSFIIVFIFQFMYDPNITKLVDKMSEDMDTSIFYCIMIVIYTVVIAVFIGIIWLFYRLLYGILMKRLQKNFDELKKIDY